MQNNFYLSNYSNNIPIIGNKRNRENNNYIPDFQQIIDKYYKNPNPLETTQKKLPEKLPIYKQEQKIIDTIINNQVTIITGKTGCGKTTQVPQIIYKEYIKKGKSVNILITQPRRIAVLNIADRLCDEMNTKKGNLVGYHYGLSDPFYSNKTAILIETTGIFLEELIHGGGQIEKYTHIILDEVHERDQHIDLVLFLVKLHIKKHPNVKLILMSATMTSIEYSNYFSKSSINNLHEEDLCVDNISEELGFKTENENIIIKNEEDDLKWCEIPNCIDILAEGDRDYYEDKKELYRAHDEMNEIDWDSIDDKNMNTEYTIKLHELQKKEDSAPVIEISEQPFECKEFFADEIMNNIIQNIKDNGEENEDQFYKDYLNFTFQNCYVPEIYTFMEDMCLKLIIWIDRKIIKGSKDTHNDAILIFLPGISQIKRVRKFIEDNINEEIWQKSFFPITLHSEVEDSEQRKVFQSSGNKRKIIFATNIAESSITIDNVTYIIDFCLTKNLQYLYRCDREMLVLHWACKASLNQRKGRAGRTKIGYVFRLIPKNFYNTLEENFSPEIQRVKLDQVILRLKLYGENESFKKNKKVLEPKIALNKLMDPPRLNRIFKSIISLKYNGALELGPQFIQRDKITCGNLTELGKIYAELPCSIVYSKLIMMTYAIGMLDIGIIIAAIFHVEKKIFKKTSQLKNITDIKRYYSALEYFSDGTNCDIITSYNAYREWFNNFGIKLFKNNDIKNKKLINLDINDSISEKSFCYEYKLDHKILREVLKNAADIKLRLIKLGVYRNSEINETNMRQPSKLRKIPNYDILKYILYGAFYRNLFLAEYEEPIKLNQTYLPNDIRNKSNELIRFPLNSKENKNFDLEVFKSIFLGEGFLSTKSCDHCSAVDIAKNSTQLLVHYSNIADAKLVLRVTKLATLNLTNTGAFYYQDDNNQKIFLEKPECNSLLKYRHYFRDRQQINIDPSCINFMNIEPENQERQKMVFFCDSFFQNNTKLKTCFTSQLPKKPMIADLMYLIFAPRVTFVANTSKDRYIGYKKDEITHIFKYSFSGSDIVEINIIRKLISDQIKVNRGDILINNYNEGVYKRINDLLNKKRFKTFDNIIWDNLIQYYQPPIQIVNYMRSYHELEKQVRENYKYIYEEDKTIFQIKEEININKNNFKFLPSLNVLNISEDLRYYSIESMKSLENERKQLLLIREKFKRDYQQIINDLENTEPKLICKQCYEKNEENLKYGLITQEKFKNNNLCTLKGIRWVNTGLYYIDYWLTNFEEIPYKNENLLKRENEIKEMMGEDYEKNRELIYSILCCGSAEQHIVGFTKKGLDNTTYSYFCQSSPLLIAFYPSKEIQPFNKNWIKAYKDYETYKKGKGKLLVDKKYNVKKIYEDQIDEYIKDFKKRTKCILCGFEAKGEIKGYVSDKRMLIKELQQKLSEHTNSVEHKLNMQQLNNEGLDIVI